MAGLIALLVGIGCMVVAAFVARHIEKRKGESEFRNFVFSLGGILVFCAIIGVWNLLGGK
jgi:Fe2+ transport system protein B